MEDKILEINVQTGMFDLSRKLDDFLERKFPKQKVEYKIPFYDLEKNKFKVIISSVNGKEDLMNSFAETNNCYIEYNNS